MMQLEAHGKASSDSCTALPTAGLPRLQRPYSFQHMVLYAMQASRGQRVTSAQ